MANGQRIAVVGATGAVGQTTLKILEERNFPVREMRVYASARSVGKNATFKGESIKIEKSTPTRSRESISRSSPPAESSRKNSRRMPSRPARS